MNLFLLALACVAIAASCLLVIALRCACADAAHLRRRAEWAEAELARLRMERAFGVDAVRNLLSLSELESGD